MPGAILWIGNEIPYPQWRLCRQSCPRNCPRANQTSPQGKFQAHITVVDNVAGSVYGFAPVKGDREDFPLFTSASGFTDGTVVTPAAVNVLRLEKETEVFVDKMHGCVINALMPANPA